MISERSWKKICRREMTHYHPKDGGMIGPDRFEEAMADVNEHVPMEDLQFKRYKAFMKGRLDREGTLGYFSKLCVWADRFNRGVALSQCDSENRALLTKIDGELGVKYD